MNLHPVALFFASNALLTLTAAYTDRRSIFRYVVLLPASAIVYLMAQSLSSRSTGWMGRCPAGSTFWPIVVFCDKLLLKKWDFNHYYPPATDQHATKRNPNVDHDNNTSARYPGTRIGLGSEVTSEPRGIGKYWQVKNVPYFVETNPAFVPSQAAFLLTNSTTVLFCYYIHNYTAGATLKLNGQHLQSSNIPLLTRIPDTTFDELQARVIATFGYWIVQYTMMQFFYCAAGTMSAIFSPENIYLWPPLFGSFNYSYTIREFWGKSWHQSLRSGIEGPSTFVAHDVLKLPQKGLLQRYSKIFFGFVLSGMLHIVADAGGDIPPHRSGAMQFFVMQALGIIIEDTIQGFYKRYLKRTLGSMAPLVQRVVGYAWVVFFLVWTSPVWIFPVLRDMRREDAMLSLEAVKPVLFGRPIPH